jgi:hypothetical protein
MAALFFQIICYFGKLGKGGLEVFDNRAVGTSEMDGEGRRGD